MFQPDFDKTSAIHEKNNNSAPVHRLSSFPSAETGRFYALLYIPFPELSLFPRLSAGSEKYKKWKQFFCLRANSRPAFTLDYAFV
jgi:hypothetical protein